MIINILQVNVGRSKAAMDLVTKNCYEKDIDIAIISEPNKKMAGNNNRWITDKESDAAIYIPKGRKVFSLKVGDGFVGIVFEGIQIFSCYLTPRADKNKIKDFLYKISQKIDAFESIIIAGDLNAKSHAWGAPVEDAKGAVVYEWMQMRNLNIMNRGKTPTFERGSSKSFIDITIASDDVTKSIKEWKVDREVNLSLHNNIYIQIGNKEKKDTPNSRKNGWIYKNTKDDQLIREIKLKGIAKTHRELETHLYRICNNTYNQKKEEKRSKGNIYWWTENLSIIKAECTKKRRKMTRLRKKKHTNSDSEKAEQEYKKAKSQLVKEIEAAKREAWRKLCDDLDQDVWGKGYKIVTGKLGTQRPITLTENEQIKAAKKLFPQTVKDKPGKNLITEVAPQLCQINEVVEAGNKLKKNKSPGPDGIPGEVIKVLAMNYPECFITVLNESLKANTFPKEWKKSKLILLEKPKKEGEESTYRPICLINAIAKLGEHIIAKRIRKELEQKEDLSDLQFGFREGKSTIEAIQTVLKERKKLGKYAALVTLDVANAFNSILWEVIIEEMRKRGISGYLINIVNNYLRERIILVGETKLVMKCGVPQGSVLGPLLWNIAYDGLLKLKVPEQIKLVGFADDVAMIAHSNSKNEMIKLINDTTNDLKNWMEKRGLKLAPHKTEIVIIKGARKIRSITANICGNEIESKTSLRYLGVHIGMNKNMGQHITNVVKKAGTMAAKLSRILPNIRGPRASKRRVMANAVTSIILYAAPVWSHMLQTKKYKDLINKAQRRVLLRVCSSYCTAATKALQVAAGCTPLHLLAEQRTANWGKEVALITDKEVRKKWQEEWEAEEEVAQWTKKLIPNISEWVDREHGEIDYYLSQIITGHGCFGHYLERFKLKTNDNCQYCGYSDTPKHTFFECEEFRGERINCNNKVEQTITPENVIHLMVKSKEHWDAIYMLIRNIIYKKEKDERDIQERNKRN